ncbi:MAG: lipoyl synthase [Candidatus Fermentibacteraceae bacterium]
MRPSWLKAPVTGGFSAGKTRRVLERLGLNTVCSEACCPNRGHCYQRNTAAFLIMGTVCTRNCRYCAVDHGKPLPPDPGEPHRLAEAASAMGLRFVVVTSVTRDDLPDGGAECFARVVGALREGVPGIMVEVLTPDFMGRTESLETVAAASPHIFNHNLETVETLFPALRPGGDYSRSLKVLLDFSAMNTGIPVKSGLMLGLGETAPDIRRALSDLRETGVSMLTLGQYLQPSKEHARVHRFITPAEFEQWRTEALGMGFLTVASGPLVRSSFHADSYASELL